MFESIYATEPEVEKVDLVVPKAPLDFSHHFSRVTKARTESKIKDFYKYFAIPGIGNLAGGLPNASLFPYDTLEAAVALPARFTPTPNDPNIQHGIQQQQQQTQTAKLSDTQARVVVPHASATTDPERKIDLTTALQYGRAQGYPPLFSFLHQFTRENLHPNVPYLGGPDIQLTVGSTDGFAKAIECLSNIWCEERDWVREREGIVVEEFAYMNAIQTCRPRGLNIVPIKMDAEGMMAAGPGGLEDVLNHWDVKKGKRPHLMYTVTIGQNPTSGTLSVARRKDIYAVCSKYDVMIIEDDPYWYLQFPSAASHEANARGTAPTSSIPYTLPSDHKSSGFPFLDSLVPSYLSVDTQGRVIRLDTFSKTVAPGCRLGWITAQPAIIERILRITEASTQQPSGFVQSMIAQLIIGPQDKSVDGGRGGTKNGQGWKVDGWVRWLEGLRGVYERRMRTMCEILEEGRFIVQHTTHTQESDSSSDTEWSLISKTEIYTFTWPRAGMFVWIHMNFSTHPLWNRVSAEKLALACWVFLTTKPYLVLAAPGGIFSPTEEIRREQGWKFFRLCFAAVEEGEVEACAMRFAKGVARFWRVKELEELEGIEGIAEVNGEGREMRSLGMGIAC